MLYNLFDELLWVNQDVDLYVSVNQIKPISDRTDIKSHRYCWNAQSSKNSLFWSIFQRNLQVCRYLHQHRHLHVYPTFWSSHL